MEFKRTHWKKAIRAVSQRLSVLGSTVSSVTPDLASLRACFVSRVQICLTMVYEKGHLLGLVPNGTTHKQLGSDKLRIEKLFVARRSLTEHLKICLLMPHLLPLENPRLSEHEWKVYTTVLHEIEGN